MATTATQTVLEQHANQVIPYLIIKNAERIVWLIQHGLVLITVVSATVASFGNKN
jgi:hypothetical protein